MQGFCLASLAGPAWRSLEQCLTQDGAHASLPDGGPDFGPCRVTAQASAEDYGPGALQHVPHPVGHPHCTDVEDLGRVPQTTEAEDALPGPGCGVEDGEPVRAGFGRLRVVPYRPDVGGLRMARARGVERALSTITTILSVLCPGPLLWARWGADVR